MPDGGGKRLRIRAAVSGHLAIGRSIAINGVCQTVIETSHDTFVVVAVEETLRKTTLGSLFSGLPVNLERAMLLQDRLDGHLVQGHIDATALITQVCKERTARLYTVELGAEHLRYVIPVGSIALDGISLTVAHIDGVRITVSIIPHTFDHTACSTWCAGSRVNVEFDMLGKYVASQLAQRNAATASPLPITTPRAR